VTVPADIEPAPSLQYLDARDYRLVVLVNLDGDVEIAHQLADDETARSDMGLLAAQILDEVGREIVDDHLQAIQLSAPALTAINIRVKPPRPGRAVLVCGRCGRAVHAHQLRRLPAVPHAPGSAPAIDPIVCNSCARKALA